MSDHARTNEKLNNIFSSPFPFSLSLSLLHPLQEYAALIKYVQLNKGSDQDWFTISSNKEGTHWSGKCWYVEMERTAKRPPSLWDLSHSLTSLSPLLRA